MNPRHRSSAKAVGSFVPKLTKKAVEKYGFSAAALITEWATIVGKETARHTEPQRLKWPRTVDAYAETESDSAGRPGATLFLMVDGAFALDIQYKGRQIIDRINSYFGYRAVAELRIVQKPAERLPIVTPRQIVAGKSQPAKPAPDLDIIGDENLRAALERLHNSMTKR